MRERNTKTTPEVTSSRTILLVSGGIDSITIFGMKKDEIDTCVVFDYGQGYIAHEREVVERVVSSFEEIIIDDLKKNEEGFFEGRNLSFVKSVREAYIDEDLVIYIGSNADDTFPDNNSEFFELLEKVINRSYEKKISIKLPLKDLSKKEVCELNEEIYGVLTGYWCYAGVKEPCGECHSCLTMKKAGFL